MNKNTVTSLLKLLSIYIFFIATTRIEFAIFQTFEFFEPVSYDKKKYLIMQILSGYLPLIIHLIFAYILWIKSEIISEKIISKNNDENLDSTEKNKNIESILYSIVGIYLLFNTIPELAKTLYSLKSSMITSFPESQTYKVMTGAIISLIIRIILSLWLIFGSHWWVKIIHQIKNYKINNKEKSDGHLS